MNRLAAGARNKTKNGVLGRKGEGVARKKKHSANREIEGGCWARPLHLCGVVRRPLVGSEKGEVRDD